MREKSLGEDVRKGGDFFAAIGALLCYLKTDAAHARINAEMEGRGFALPDGFPAHGDRKSLLKEARLDAESLADAIYQTIKGGHA